MWKCACVRDRLPTSEVSVRGINGWVNVRTSVLFLCCFMLCVVRSVSLTSAPSAAARPMKSPSSMKAIATANGAPMIMLAHTSVQASMHDSFAASSAAFPASSAALLSSLTSWGACIGRGGGAGQPRIISVSNVQMRACVRHERARSSCALTWAGVRRSACVQRRLLSREMRKYAVRTRRTLTQHLQTVASYSSWISVSSASLQTALISLASSAACCAMSAAGKEG